MIDTPRVRARLALLARYRRRLAGLRDLPRDSYLRDHDLEGRYALQVAAQICIDLANHVIVASGWEPVRDFRDSFTRLESTGWWTAHSRSGSGPSPGNATGWSTSTTTSMTRWCTTTWLRDWTISTTLPAPSPAWRARSRRPDRADADGRCRDTIVVMYLRHAADPDLVESRGAPSSGCRLGSYRPVHFRPHQGCGGRRVRRRVLHRG